MFLFILFSFVFSVSAEATYEYQSVVTQDGQFFSGQVIGSYEEKWFWELDKDANQYLGLFQIINERPQIKFFNRNDIKLTASEHKPESNYHQFLKANDLFLQRAPLNGWNYILTGNEGHHQHENMYGNFAWDIARSMYGKTFKGQGLKNQDYYVWNQPVYSPIKGVVAAVVRSAEDNPVDRTLTGDLSGKGDGNYILIHTKDLFYFSLVHFKKDSIPKNLKVGSVVEVGDFLGNVGNSGVVYIPHLHMTMYYWSPELKRMLSVPTLMKKMETVTALADKPLIKEAFSPTEGQSIRTYTRSPYSSCAPLFDL